MMTAERRCAFEGYPVPPGTWTTIIGQKWEKVWRRCRVWKARGRDFYSRNFCELPLYSPSYDLGCSPHPAVSYRGILLFCILPLGLQGETRLENSFIDDNVTCLWCYSIYRCHKSKLPRSGDDSIGPPRSCRSSPRIRPADLASPPPIYMRKPF